MPHINAQSHSHTRTNTHSHAHTHARARQAASTSVVACGTLAHSLSHTHTNMPGGRRVCSGGRGRGILCGCSRGKRVHSILQYFERLSRFVFLCSCLCVSVRVCVCFRSCFKGSLAMGGSGVYPERDAIKLSFTNADKSI